MKKGREDGHRSQDQRTQNTQRTYSGAVSYTHLIGPNQRNLPLKEGAQVIKYALGRGINFIDTAQYYRTYPYIREAMRQLKDESSLASRPVICSKCLGADYESMKDAVEEARDALDIDVIDIFPVSYTHLAVYKRQLPGYLL